MQVHDRLSRGLSVVDADVVAVRGEFLVQGFLRLVHGLKNCGFLDGLQLEEGLNVAFGDDEGVAFRDGESVPDGEGVVGLGDDPVRFQVTEDAGFTSHRFSRFEI